MKSKIAIASLIFSILALPSFLAAFAVVPDIVFDPRTGEGNNSSTNWSGYAVTAPSGSVTSVSGSWRVPGVSCASRGTTYAAFWAGIDGFNSNSVEQAGILVQCRHGSASYSAWYEFYPNPSVTIGSITVNPTDNVAVTVSYSSGSFKIIVTDGVQSYTKTGTASTAALSSAECIAERPSTSTGLTKLANFGTAYFGQDSTGISSTCSTTINGVTGSFGSFGSAVQEVAMVNSRGSVLAQPSSLSSDGTSFSIKWYRSS